MFSVRQKREIADKVQEILHATGQLPQEILAKRLHDATAKLAAVEAERKDAERYRWLRAQNWDTGPLVVVRDPQHAIKLGHDAPSLFRLDEAIDAAMSALAERGK
jgi:hypothetical protein